jgi:hypothetical protein
VNEVRDHVFSLINEICSNYDIDGLELDFMRHGPFFRQAQTSLKQREKIMCDFLKRVRICLDKGAGPGQRRWLSVRVPFTVEDYNIMGINLPKFIDCGVDMVNLSCGYITQQQNDVAKICKMIPDTPVFIEFTYLTAKVKLESINKIEGKQVEQFALYRHTTDEQIYTLAHLAYTRGVQGVSAFNFTYYRRFDEKIIGTACEPPFHVFRRIRDKDIVAKESQHYFLSKNDWAGNRVAGKYSANQLRKIKIDMSPPSHGWRNDGRLRIQTEDGFGEAEVKVEFNGKQLSSTDNVSEFYPVANPDALGDNTNLMAWTLPADIIIDGVNTITVKASEKIMVSYIDIGLK